MTATTGAAAVWHDLECGSYGADLALWEDLADEAGGAVLDLGCGTGRVAIHLARRGHRVLGLDSDPELLSVMAGRGRGLPLEAEVGDARDLDLGTRFALVLAPMQLVQLLAGAEERRECLRGVAAHLRPGGLAAFALVEALPPPDGGSSPLPDATEIDGWVYSSLPVASSSGGGVIAVRRLRQTVSPSGELSDAVEEITLAELTATALEAEAAGAGLRAGGRRAIPPTDAHVGSTVVLLRGDA